MAKSGPKALPANVHRLHGTYRTDRHGGELKVDTLFAIPDPPGRLSAIGAAEWRRLAPELHKLGLLTALDLTTLEMYCTVYARWIAAELALKGENTPGITLSPNGYPQQSVNLQITNASIKQLQSLCAEFGMTPATRARLRMIEKQPEQLDLLSLLDQASQARASK